MTTLTDLKKIFSLILLAVIMLVFSSQVVFASSHEPPVGTPGSQSQTTISETSSVGPGYAPAPYTGMDAPTANFVPLTGVPGVTNTGDLTFGGYVNALFRLTISLAALLAVIKIVLAGIKYMGSEGFSSKGEAKEDITNALLGLLIILSTVIILYTINPNILKLRLATDAIYIPPYEIGIGIGYDETIDKELTDAQLALAAQECSNKGGELLHQKQCAIGIVPFDLEDLSPEELEVCRRENLVSTQVECVLGLDIGEEREVPDSELTSAVVGAYERQCRANGGNFTSTPNSTPGKTTISCVSAAASAGTYTEDEIFFFEQNRLHPDDVVHTYTQTTPPTPDEHEALKQDCLQKTTGGILYANYEGTKFYCAKP